LPDGACRRHAADAAAMITPAFRCRRFFFFAIFIFFFLYAAFDYAADYLHACRFLIIFAAAFAMLYAAALTFSLMPFRHATLMLPICRCRFHDDACRCFCRHATLRHY
jgi:hypothetical protein